MANTREDIRQSATDWLNKIPFGEPISYKQAFESGVLWSEATLKTRENMLNGHEDEYMATMKEEIVELTEENKRLKETITAIESDTQIGELLDAITAKDRELSELRTSNKALREALQGSIKVIRSLIASERIVNLDEALAYYEAALSASAVETKQP